MSPESSISIRILCFFTWLMMTALSHQLSAMNHEWSHKMLRLVPSLQGSDHK